MKKIDVVDLFCGVGGMSLGFENAGFNVISAYDNWDKAVKVYEKNFSHPVYLEDLSQFNDYYKLEDADIIIGGPPCQDFSSAGKRNEYGVNANLTIKYADIITKVSPHFFVMENVDRVEKSQAFFQAEHILKKAGYGITKIVLDASKTNVPQKRKRFFMIGELNGKDNSLYPYLVENLNEKSMTMRDYFGNSLGIDHYYRHPRNYNRRGIFSMDEPSPTIRGVNRPLPSGYKGHPRDSSEVNNTIRPLTTIERSYVQTFPVGFFNNTIPKTHIEQMIGNAVPVNLAKYVAECLKNYINKENIKIGKEQLSFQL